MKQIHLAEHGPLKDIVDLADPVHVMASCRMDPDQEREALSHFQAFQGAPLQFSRLRKTPAGQKAILAFLNSDAVDCETTGAFVIHKPHFLAFQHCRLILDPLLMASGLNGLEPERCLELANLLVYGMPVGAPPALWSEYLRCLYQAMRIHTPQSLSAWISAAEKLHSHIPENFSILAECVAPVIELDPHCGYFTKLKPDWNTPRAFGYLSLTEHWAPTPKEPFDWVVEGSGDLFLAIREIQALALQPADPDADGKLTHDAPYASQVHDIVAGNPHSHPQLALADILGGALATAIHAMTRAKAQAGTFATEIIEADDAKGLVFSRLWPEQDLDFLKLMRMNDPSVSDLSRSNLLPPPASGDGWFA